MPHATAFASRNTGKAHASGEAALRMYEEVGLRARSFVPVRRLPSLIAATNMNIPRFPAESFVRLSRISAHIFSRAPTPSGPYGAA